MKTKTTIKFVKQSDTDRRHGYAVGYLVYVDGRCVGMVARVLMKHDEWTYWASDARQTSGMTRTRADAAGFLARHDSNTSTPPQSTPPAAPSGYTDCACRDCFEIAIGVAGDAYCHGCREEGCPDYQGQPGMSQECQRDDAYGCGEETPTAAASMGCLCAGHARGNDASAPCDASEGTPVSSEPCKCGIQWVDSNGNPTPDSNPAVGVARLVIYYADGAVQTSDHPICETHLHRMPPGPSVAYDGERFLYRSQWTYTPYATQAVPAASELAVKGEPAAGMTARAGGRTEAEVMALAATVHGTSNDTVFYDGWRTYGSDWAWGYLQRAIERGADRAGNAATEYSVIWRRSVDDDWTEHHERGMSLARCREVVAMFEQRQWRILRRDSPHSATTHLVARGGAVTGVR